MVPVLVAAIGCVLVIAIGSIFMYQRAKVHVSGDSDDEDESEEIENESSMRMAAETAALMNGESESLDAKVPRRQSVHGQGDSIWSSILSVFVPGAVRKNSKTKNALMHRRNHGVKKIHKPYFYPLLDETAQWFAEWESTKLHANQVEVVDVRIDKPKDLPPPPPSPSSPRDYLDSLDCVSLAGFRSSNHTVMPVAVI